MAAHLEFVMTQDHVALLTRAYVSWQDCETGAPEIDPKRPYGDSDVAGNVAEILGWKMPDLEDDAYEAFEARALDLHNQTATALQIVLSCKTFEPGTYVRDTAHDRRSWRRKE